MRQKAESVRMSAALSTAISSHGAFSPALRALVLLGLAQAGGDLAALQDEVDQLAASPQLSGALRQALRGTSQPGRTTVVPRSYQPHAAKPLETTGETIETEIEMYGLGISV